MDAQNRTLLKGGLPMSSSDFVDPSKAKETKLKILAALDHINEIHSEQMNPVDNSGELNNNAINNTIDIMNSDYKMDEYIFDNQIVRHDDAQTSQNFDSVDTNQGEPMFTNDSYEEPTFSEVSAPAEEPMFVNEEAGDYSQSVDLNNISSNQGEPTLVLSDNEVGKRKKEPSKTKEGRVKSTPEAVKKGKKVAWLAYILFFIPLLFMKNNTFVRHHANEGLELNIMDVIAIALFLVPRYVTSANQWIDLVLVVSNVVGLVLIALSTITKLFLIIFSWAGKEATSPWFGKTKMIR